MGARPYSSLLNSVVMQPINEIEITTFKGRSPLAPNSSSVAANTSSAVFSWLPQVDAASMQFSDNSDFLEPLFDVLRPGFGFFFAAQTVAVAAGLVEQEFVCGALAG